LRKIVIREQRRSEGLLPTKELSAAALKTSIEHLADYEGDLKGQEVVRHHVKDTCRRIARIFRENGWTILADMTGGGFTTWRAKFKGSAKTKKEYQVSLNAFANWLERQVRIESNPFKGVSRVETRGRQFRVARPFTVEEFQRLLHAAGQRAVAYQTLAYTAQRMIEVYKLRWCDLRLDGSQPKALFRVSTTKDLANRWIPLPLAVEIRSLWLPAYGTDRRVFWHLFPARETFLADLKASRIAQKGSEGEIVGFHSFRKCLGEWAVECGVAQKATLTPI
jgi:integrase